ncbi:hypothetical protein FRB94_013302 [Tulasnella sp. JGI-2019a]|nr:hypothetical protein FRB94_013302 [Tulasnella sp. JGI-2019a]
MLEDLAAGVIGGAILKLVGKCRPPHFHKATTVAKNCFKVLKFEHEVVKYIENPTLEKAINLSQGAITAANKPPPSPDEETEWDKILNQQFEEAFQAIRELYITMYSVKDEKVDNFIEAFGDAKARDKLSVERRHTVLSRIGKAKQAALSKGDDLKNAFTAATVPVILSVVDNTTGFNKRILERQVDANSIRFLETMRLHGFMYKLTTEGFSLQHFSQFFLCREKQHNITNDGVVFEKLGDKTSLKAARQKDSEKPLELFLVVLKDDEPLVAVTCGYVGDASAGRDFGELIQKPNAGSVIKTSYGGGGGIYRSLNGKSKVPHEQLKWTDLEKGYWILPLKGNIASNVHPPSAVNHRPPIVQTPAKSKGTILEPRPLPGPPPQPGITPPNGNSVSQNPASAIPTPEEDPVGLPTGLPTPDSKSGSPIPQTMPLPQAPHFNDPSYLRPPPPQNPVPICPPVNTPPASAPKSVKITPPEIPNLDRHPTTSVPPKTRPVPNAPVTTKASAAPAPKGPIGSKRTEPPSSSAPKPQPTPAATTSTPTPPEAESCEPKAGALAPPIAETQERKRRLPGTMDIAPEEEDNSWRGWMRKKVVRKVVRYVWGVPQYE